MSGAQLPPDAIEAILKYLDLPLSSDLPLAPFEFLSTHLRILPSSLLTPLSKLVPPRQRSFIPLIKSRRLVYASQQPRPPLLRADRGRLRWPLLWERLGGSSLPVPSSEVEEEENWVESEFNFRSVDGEPRQHVRKLGGFLRELEEEREQEGVREARRAERRLDDVGEEFDSDSDDEDERQRDTTRIQSGLAIGADVDQEKVKESFEKRLLEIFVDGLDIMIR
ncbi:hypothetical protein BCR39DRAFT_536996 [Naematelia encephala]|uniref:CCD97-like C-terminal domain-containing protein n=1 Tax=Naematelia encephala TaxID=71784 RepID=A0A1Y2B0Z9_9TREE|nr:hypothetical protein BCR39DRAFT_536996 [Naematelia encephala]